MLSRKLHFSSSGDVLADRRYDYAAGLMAAGDPLAAADLLRQALAIAPQWAAAWFALGEALMAAEQAGEATEAFKQTLSLDPADALGAGVRLALLSNETPASLPQAHVRALFDQYAPRFERELRENLAYRGPELIVAALERFLPRRSFPAGLDLGCGTGLMAKALADRVGAIDGVDLSPAMVAQAAKTERYRTLVAEDCLTFLAKAAAPAYDLVVAADVFVYFGDLRPVLAAACRRLSAAGVLAFTTQLAPGEGYRLGRDYRFAHSPAYLEGLAGELGCRLLCLDEMTARRDRGEDVPGLLALWQAP